MSNVIPQRAVMTMTGTVAWPPEPRKHERGDFVTFTILVHETWSGGERKQYFRCAAFGPAAEPAADLRQGDLITFRGDARRRKYEKRNDDGEMETVTDTEYHARFSDCVEVKHKASASALSLPDDELPW